MSIWYDGTNLNMYRGDAGRIIFKNLPCATGYRVYFSVVNETSKEIIFECSGDPEYYYINVDDGTEYEKNEGETDEEFIIRMEELVDKGDAIKKGRCIIFVTSEQTEKLFLLKSETEKKFYFGLKICFSSTGLENTLIPQTTKDEETGEIIFKNPPEIIIRQKYVEGILPCNDFDDIEIAVQDPKTYGLQPLLAPISPLSIDKENNLTIDFNLITLNKLANVEITDPEDGDILVYRASTGTWINKHPN